MACGHDKSTSPGTNGVPAAVALVSGDAQIGNPGASLAAPIVALVTNAQGNAIAGTTVAFAVARGGGSVTNATVTTDANGRAQTSWTLGSASVRQVVKVVAGNASQLAKATVDTTRSLFLLGPDTVSVGDTIWLNAIAGFTSIDGERRGAVVQTFFSNIDTGRVAPRRIQYLGTEFITLAQPSQFRVDVATSGPNNYYTRQLYLRYGLLAKPGSSNTDVVITNTAAGIVGAGTFTDLSSRVSVVGATVHIR